MKKKKVNPLVKSSVIYLLATGMGQGMTFLGIIVFTRLMPKSAYGDYSTYYAYVSIFTVIIGCNLGYALNNAYIDKANRIKDFRKSVMFMSNCIALVVTLSMLLFGALIFQLESPFIILMMACHAYGFFLINYRINSANMENDYWRKQWLLMLPFMFQFLFALLLIVLFPSHTFVARVIGSVVGVGVVGVWSYIEIMRCPGKLINKDDWKYALSISVPSIVMSLSYHIMEQCDKVMITKYCGSEETAVYSVIYYLGYAMIAVNLAVSPVRQAWLYKKLDKQNLEGTIELQKGYLLVFAFIATVVMMFGELVVKLIAPPSYWQFGYIVPFVCGACMMVLYPFYTEIILFYKKNMVLSLSILVAALTNIALNAVCIPRFGAVAACYTTVVSCFIVFILTSIIARNSIKNVYSRKYFVIFLFWLVCISTISYITVTLHWLRWILYSVSIITMLAYAAYNKEMIKTLFQSESK